MATSPQLLTRFSYPKVPGDQPWSIIDVRGPANYALLLTGTPPTGGQLVTAAAFGLQSIDFAMAMDSQNGAWNVHLVPDGFAVGGSFTGVRIAWSSLNAGTQAPAATDLSAAIVRLMAIGH